MDEQRDYAEEAYNARFCQACGTSPCGWDGQPDGFHTDDPAPAPEPYRTSVTLPATAGHPYTWTITWPAGWTPPGYHVTTCPACGQVTERYSDTDPRTVHADTGWARCGDPATWKETS
jgi:hypothetical protein